MKNSFKKKIIFCAIIGIVFIVGNKELYTPLAVKISSGSLTLYVQSFFEITPPRLIAHAGGGIQGTMYTNSLEALSENYAQGFRYFEVDLSWTSDNKLVLVHDWSDMYKKLFNRDDGIPDSTVFKSIQMNYDLTQMTLEDLFFWLKNHQDVKIVTDVKERNMEALQHIVKTDYQDYFVPQVYNEDEIRQARKLGFKYIILTLYKTDYDNEKILDIAKKYNLFAVTMDKERATQGDLSKQLQERNVVVYVHTINDAQEIPALKTLGVYGFYTDFITPEDIHSTQQK